MKHLIKYTSVILLMTLATTLFQSCNKQDPEPPATDVNTNFDDLSYFQNCIIRVDSLGNFKYRAYGELLDANDSTHLFIGVDELAQAEQFFREWIAPDVEITEDHGNLNCPLTDKDGNAQGTVYFRPTSGNGLIAEVSASDDTRLLYFRRITFMHNDNWPYTAPESKWHKFDIVHDLDIPIEQYLWDEDHHLNWVCVRESGNGVPPIFCAVTTQAYPNTNEAGSASYAYQQIVGSWFVPRMGGAKNLGNILQADWELFKEVFHEANGVDNLHRGMWIDDHHDDEYVIYTLHYDEVFYYKDNGHYGERSDAHYYLLKIEWVDDEDIYDGATIPNHQ